LVSTTPVSGSASAKALAVLAASWPVIASTTNRVSTGSIAACRALISAIIASSIGEAAGGVDQQHVDEGSCARHRSRRGRCPRASARRRMDGTARRPAGQRLQLLDRGRTVDVAADHHDLLLAPLLQVLGQLADGGGLARALQAGHQDHRRRRHVEVQVARLRAHHRGQLVAHDLDQGLARRQALQHFLADRAHLDALDQRLHHRQRDVGLEQGDAHLAQVASRMFSSVSRPRPRRRSTVVGQALAEGLEHAESPACGNGPRSIAQARRRTDSQRLTQAVRNFARVQMSASQVYATLAPCRPRLSWPVAAMPPGLGRGEARRRKPGPRRQPACDRQASSCMRHGTRCAWREPAAPTCTSSPRCRWSALGMAR
jgi:hypothetical protein